MYVGFANDQILESELPELHNNEWLTVQLEKMRVGKQWEFLKLLQSFLLVSMSLDNILYD